ncbi:hypothetical protein Btru_076501 [Bulinus truncatus]|nr:hypothetical protein Btru_076501 [Bulinus truncatus]
MYLRIFFLIIISSVAWRILLPVAIPLPDRQIITFSNYYTSSECDRGIVLINEALMIRSTVILGSLPKTDTVVMYQLQRQKKEAFHVYCYLNVHDECNGAKKQPCYCTSSITSGIYEVYINVSSQVNNSEALLKGTLDLPRLSYESEIKTLPKIFDDQPSHLLKLFIDNQKMDLQNCRKTTNDPLTIFLAQCFDGLPCILEIIDYYSNQRLEGGTNMTSYSYFANSAVKERKITIRYEVCKRPRSVNCYIKHDNKGNNGTNEISMLLNDAKYEYLIAFDGIAQFSELINI